MTAVALALLLAAPPVAAGTTAAAEPALRLTHVRHAPVAFEVTADERAEVRFRLSASARVTLRIYDPRDREVVAIPSEGVLAPGDHALAWNGRTARRRRVPPGAYRYTLSATASNGEAVAHDLSDVTGGDAVRVRDLRYDAGAGLVRYRLLRPARVHVWAGAPSPGPMLATLVDWAPRPAGPSAEPWTPDEAVQRLAPEPALVGRATALAGNALIVLSAGRGARSELLPVGERPLRPGRKPATPRQRDPAIWPPEQRGDFALTLRVDERRARRRETAIPIRIEATAREAQRLYAERFGVELYVDGVLAFKNELGYLPLTWQWNPADLAPGPHVITTNVFGYAGNRGAASVIVTLPERGDAR